jgi:leucyl aminopeptidase
VTLSTATQGGLPTQPAPTAFDLSAQPPEQVGAEVEALPFWFSAEADALVVGPGGADLTDDLLAVLDLAGATGRAGEIVTHYAQRGSGLHKVLLVGVGAQRRADFRRAGAALARATKGAETVATTVVALEPEVALEPFVAGATLGAFRLDWTSTPSTTDPVGRMTLAELDPAYAPALTRAVAIARASWRSRFLATVPSNLKSPAWLADQAVAAAAEAGLTVTVWEEQQLAEEGFGGILGVGQGSVSPPRLVRLDYAPPKAGRKTPTVVLVGKGITFDTGGLDIKPGEGMTTMKRDMTGAGAVLATMAALAEVGCPVKVTGLLAIAENSVSGSSMRPGDVIRHYGGRTSEITNTDAEGRLVLADAMAYAVARIKPDAIVDIATLTGAMKVGLGQSLGGFFASSEALAAAIREAGAVSGEEVWRMPLAEVYEERLASKVADADNSAGGPIAITAALFLQHFAGGLPWVHLDIASIGDAAKDEFEWTPGPTGFGARLLLSWLGSPEPLAGL